MSTIDLAKVNKSNRAATSPSRRDKLERDYELDGYTLLERIGAGGEAEIWSAWERRHQRVVAIKLMYNRGETAYYVEQMSKEFTQQVQVLTGLAHPHVLPLYTFGHTDEFYYFVMRYCCLGSLADLLAKGPIPLDEVFRLTAQISSALAYLHDQSVVHRDLKPSNILLDSQRRVYLADFGLAKRLAVITSPLHTGRGTGAYAPFEQHALQTIMPQSDIYSLGVLIYEMLTGKLPWDGTVYLAERQFKANVELPDPREINPGVPASLVAVLRQMTAYQWEMRPQSVTEALALLLAALPQEKQATVFARHDTPSPLDEALLLSQDARYFWQQFQAQWRPHAAAFPAPFTHFALMDSVYAQAPVYQVTLDAPLCQFMLRGALTHDYNISTWWNQVDAPQPKATICEQTITWETDGAAIRVLTQLLYEPEDAFPPGTFAPTTLEYWLNVALNARSWNVRNQAFKLLQRLAPRFKRWQGVSISVEADKKLALLALTPGSQAMQAAQLIGQVRSKEAVQAILKAQSSTPEATIVDIVQTIRASAGTLPGVVPGAIRRRVFWKRLEDQLREDKDGLSWPRAFMGLAVGFVLSLFFLLGLFSQPEAQLKDIYLESYAPSGIVTIVEVNDESLARYGRWDSWPRARHAELVDRLREAGAKVIVFDFVFDTATGEDALLAAAMKQAGNVVQPILGVGDAYSEALGEVRYEQRILPQTDLLQAAAAAGHTNILHDQDGYVRRLPTLITAHGEHYPSIVLAALQVYLGTANASLSRPENGWLTFLGRQIPVEYSGAMSIYYAGPPAQTDNHTFPMVSYQDVLDGAAATDLFQDKIVLVGITATAEPDRYLTPVSKGHPMYGIEILANALETIWSRRFIRPVSPLMNVLIILALAVLTGLVTVRPTVSLLRVGALGVVYFLFATIFFDFTGLALSLFFPLLTISLSFSVVTAYRFSLATRRHREMRQLFEAHVNPAVASATILAVQKGEIALGGRDQLLTALLVQVQGHTQVAEQLGTEELVGLIQRLRNFVVAAAFHYDGTIVDVRSDQVLVLFNTPLPQPDHARRAVQTAFAIRAELQTYQQTLPGDHLHRQINLGYALYTGHAIVGYTGSASRYVYTALGEAINMVMHLVNAAAPGQIVVGNTTLEKVTDLVLAVSIEPVTISGIVTPIPLFVIRPLPTPNKKTGS